MLTIIGGAVESLRQPAPPFQRKLQLANPISKGHVRLRDG